jgi:hypothetical protein
MPLSKRITTLSLIVALIAAITFVISPVTPLRADTFQVTNNDDSGAGSLRQAILDANAANGADTITFAGNVVGTITLTTGQLAITDSLTIIGPGASTLTISGNNGSTVLSITAGAVVSISGLTIANGSGLENTGGIYNLGALSITDSIIRNNFVDVRGGGIFNDSSGTLVITRSTIRDNIVNGFGGGILNRGTLTVIDSTISGNTATNEGGFGGSGGGGIYNTGMLTIFGSTISGNSAVIGGGIYNFYAPVSITNTTITNNSAEVYGGGGIDFGDIIFRNSIIAGNSAPQWPNMVGDDVVGSNNLTNVDPGLGPLADNGGPTQTHLPQAGSLAINAGDNSFLSELPGVDYNGDGDFADTFTAEQRGLTRIINGTVDIGAVEVQLPTATVVSSVRANPNPTNAASADFTVTFSAPVTGITALNFGTFTTGGISGASITNVSGSGTTYTITVNTGSGDGTLRLDVVNDSGLDRELINVPFTSGEAYTIDKTAPTVTINQAAGQSDPTATLPIRFDVVFSESVSGFANAADISLAGSTADVSVAAINITGSGAAYTVEVSGVTGTGTVVTSVVAGAASDGVGNTSTASTSTDNSVTYDPSVPSATIMRADANPTDVDSVRYTVTFSQDVSGVDTDPATQTDFEVIISGTLSGVAITEITGSGAVYTVTISTGTGTGTIRLNLNDNDSITNSLTVPLGGVGADNGDVIGTEYTIRPPQPIAQPVFSTPQPVPLCALIGGGTNSIVRASVPGGLNADVFCRILNENGVYVRDAAEVGDQTLINAGIVQAVDVFGFSAGGVQVAAFNQPIRVCLQGSGRLFFRDATTAPRVTMPLIAASENGYTCGSISNAGTVVLVR